MDWVKGELIPEFFQFQFLNLEAVANSKLERIFIDGNNLVCDTRLKPFKDHFENSKTSSKIYNVFQPTELKCSSPPELIGKVAKYLHLFDLTSIFQTLNTINYNQLVVVSDNNDSLVWSKQGHLTISS